MATTHIYLKTLHLDHKLWMNEMKFYKEELALLRDQLGEVINKNTDKEAMAQGEHFQNQFIRQNEVADTLTHDIRVREDALVKYAKENQTAIEHTYFDDQKEDHDTIRERMDIFKKIYSDLKAEFLRYLAKWM